MNIDVLQKAADAAGYAMAAPDDDVQEAAGGMPASANRAPSTALTVVTETRRAGGDAFTIAAGWIKGYLPTYLGGRAPA
jgi:hypothetical protein